MGEQDRVEDERGVLGAAGASSRFIIARLIVYGSSSGRASVQNVCKKCEPSHSRVDPQFLFGITYNKTKM